MLVSALQPSGKVHAVADHRIVHSIGRAYGSGSHLAGRKTDTDLDWLGAPADAPKIELSELADHFDGGADGVVGIGGARRRCPKYRHNRVADVLIESTAIALH